MRRSKRFQDQKPLRSSPAQGPTRTPPSVASATILTLVLLSACAIDEVGDDAAAGAGGFRQLAGAGGWAGQAGAGGVGGQADEPPMAGQAGGAGGVGAGGVGGESSAAGAGGQAPAAGAGGTANGAGGAGGQRSACAPHPFCDGFEDYATGTTPTSREDDANWRIAPNPDKVRVDDSRAYSGKKSLKINIPTSGNSGVDHTLSTIRNDLFPATKLYARMMYYLDGQPAGKALHWALMGTQGSFPRDGAVSRSSARWGLGGVDKDGRAGSQVIMAAQGGDDGFLDCWHHVSKPLPTGRWVCLEWALDTKDHSTRVSIDGAASSDLSIRLRPQGGSFGCIGGSSSTPWYVPTLHRFSIGYQHWHNSSKSRTLWIDDVVISDTPIGCPAKNP